MTVLVDDLLLLARLDAGRPLEREPVDMSRVAIDATSDARVARPTHRWLLDLPDDPVMALGDEHRLHQVLVNLLSNAGGHTPQGTTVTVKLTATPGAVADILPAGPLPGPGADDGLAAAVSRGALPAAPRLVLTVTDDGPGIQPDLLPELFERFTRADTARSHAGDHVSTGLGLAIVDAVVAAHGGSVQVASRPGQTRFAIILPLLAAPAEDPPRRTRTNRRARALFTGGINTSPPDPLPAPARRRTSRLRRTDRSKLRSRALAPLRGGSRRSGQHLRRGPDLI
jgi:two-component system OmpR family sensor kinase